MKRWKYAIGFMLALCACASAEARVVRIVMQEQKNGSEARRGIPPGYRVLQGIAYGELDPRDPHNLIVQDIDLAPKNTRGMVKYSATVTLYAPLQPNPKAVLLYEIVNRGRSQMPREYANGDYFLLSGWQGDLVFGGPALAGGPGETIQVPSATGVTGAVMARFYDLPQGQKTLALARSATYVGSGVPPLPVNLETHHAHLMTKKSEESDGTVSGLAEVPQEDWSWGDCSRNPFPGRPDAKQICLKNGADASLLYELRYTAKDPLVLGVGLAAIRDVNAFFYYEAKDDAGTVNPVYGKVRAAIGLGISQSGNTLRSLLNLGFNQDERGRTVWKGAMSIIAARQTPENVRFGVPGGTSMLYDVGTDGVNWWGHSEDAARHQPAGGLLDRCTATKSCPKIVELFGSTEFYALRASMNLVGTSAVSDLPLPESVRRYYVAGTTHGGGGGGFHRAQGMSVSNCALAANPNPEGPTRRALLLALKQWVVNGTAPPSSVYPTLTKGTLAGVEKVLASFPVIPGSPAPTKALNPNIVYGLGPEFRSNDLSGVVASEPPAVVGVVPGVLPTTDVDGNEVGGVRTPLRDTPLGTYTGWNVVVEGFRKGQFCSLNGGYIPFAATKVERVGAGDPRLSVEERYRNHAEYVDDVRNAAQRLVRQRLMLQDDADKTVAEAEASEVRR